MEERIVTTTSGYKVHLQPWISYPKYIEIQKIFTATVMVDPKAKQEDIPPFPANLTYDAEEKVIRYLIKKIEDKDGNAVDVSQDYLPLPPEDCLEVKAVVDEINNKATAVYSKKNTIPSSNPPSAPTTPEPPSTTTPSSE